VSLYGRHMYEHHLPSNSNALTKVCGEDALRLLVELLEQAAAISGKERYGYYSSDPIASDERAQHDIYDALLSAVRRSADSLWLTTRQKCAALSNF